MGSFPFNSASSPDAPATNAQKAMILYCGRQAQLEPEKLIEFIQETTGKAFNELTKREASRVIDALRDQQYPRPMRRAPY